METNVNKASSWEDVLNNNFNAEPQEEVVALQEDQVEQPEQVTEQVTELFPEPSGEVAVDATGEVIEQLSQISELDPRKQALVDAILDGKEDLVYNYFKQKNTDYNQFSDIDVIKTKIAKDNPNWDSEDIELELESKYGSVLLSERINLDEIDKDIYPDEYKEALKINKDIDKAEKLLKRDAKETRATLEELKNNIELPVSERKWVEQNTLNKASEGAPESYTPEELQQIQAEWISAVEKGVPEVSEFKFKLGDEDVSYKITEDEQKQLVDKMKGFNAENYLLERGWLNQDGSPNVKKITEDVYILENNEKIFRSGWTQAKEKAKMDLISKDIKNINLDRSPETFDAKGSNPYSFGDYVLGL
jgi:hypothetical protein